jgi:predicted nucleic acid-binding protein
LHRSPDENRQDSDRCGRGLRTLLRNRLLLIDERRGRQVARVRGLPVVGVAGVLLAARRTGRLASIGAVLSELSQQHYRLSDALVYEVLRLAGELD